MAAQLTMIAMLMTMCLTCLHSAVGGQQQPTENTDALREELHRMIMADVMMEVRQQTEEQMTTLSAAICRLEDENTALKQNIGALKQDNVALKQDNRAMQHDDAGMKQDITALKQENIVLKQQVEGQNSVIGNLVGENTVIKQEIQHMLSDPRHDEESIQVAFSVVSHSNFGPVSQDTIIPFWITYVNVGLCWNEETNVFQALVGGVYMFTVSMRGTGNDNAYTDIILTTESGGPTIVASMLALGGTYGDGANSVILELVQGDVVYVQLRAAGSGEIHSSASQVYSTFSGFLLFQ